MMEFNLPFPKQSTDTSESFLRWKSLKQRLLCHLKQKNPVDFKDHSKESHQTSVLLHLAGDKIYNLVKSYLPLEKNGDERMKHTVNELLCDIENLCLPLFILLYERFKFFTYCQNESDNIIKFILVLNSLVSYCELYDSADGQFLNQLMNGVCNEDLRSELLQQKPKSLKEVLTVCLKFDALKQNYFGESAKKKQKMKLEDTVELISEMCEINSRPTESFCSEHIANKKTALNSIKDKSSVEVKKDEKRCKSNNSIIENCLLSPSPYNEAINARKTRSKSSIISNSGKSLPETKVQKISKESLVVKKAKRVERTKTVIDSSWNIDNPPAAANEVVSATSSYVCKQEIHDSMLSYISKEDVLTEYVVDKLKLRIENIKSLSSEGIVTEVSNEDDRSNQLSNHRQQKKCPVCKMEFQSSRKLYYHKHTHYDQLQFKCDICKMVFMHCGSRSRHMRNAHPELMTMKCEQCDLWFDRQTSLDFHKQTHTKSITCTECGKMFTKTKEFYQHRKKEHINFCLPCDQCELTFPFPSRLKIHQMTKHNAPKPYICEVCGSSFAEHSMLVSHKNYHLGNRKFQCVTCGRRFVLRSSMRSHMPTHLEEKPHICIVCGVGFKLENYLKTHMKIHINNRVKPHVCSKCGAAYLKASHLKNHEWKHTGQKPYKCDTCGSSFYQSSSLKKHIKYMHEGYRPQERFSCEYCGLSFSFSSKLKLHIMKHTGEKPYSCNVCSSAYREKSQLMFHMKSHSGQERYKCSICNQQFQQKAYLEGHIRKHTGEKPFVCSICDARFTHKSYLRDHEKVHILNRERKHKCGVCGKAFTCSSHMRSHERLHSGEKPHSCPICDSRFTKRSSVKKHLRRTHGVQKIFEGNNSLQLSNDGVSLTQLNSIEHHDDVDLPILPHDIHSDPHQEIHLSSDSTLATPSGLEAQVLNEVLSDVMVTELQPHLQQLNALCPAVHSQSQQPANVQPSQLQAQLSSNLNVLPDLHMNRDFKPSFTT